MAKTNNNNTMTKVSVRLFGTTDGKVILISKNENAGLNYTAIEVSTLPNGDVNEVTWVNSSRINIAQDVEPLVRALYPKTVKPIDSAATCRVLTSFRTVLKEDISIICFSEKLPCEVMSYNDKDVNGVSLKEYVLNTFGYPDQTTGQLTVGFDLTDIDAYDLQVTVPEYKVIKKLS